MKFVLLLCMVTFVFGRRMRQDEGWTKVGTVSYIKAYAGPANWATAQSICESKNMTLTVDGQTQTFHGHLAYDKTEKTHQLLKAELQRLGGSGEMWLGSTDASSEGTWNWGDGTAVANPGHWDPSDLELELVNKGQHCLALGWQTADNWDDQQCTDSQMYACQIDLV